VDLFVKKRWRWEERLNAKGRSVKHTIYPINDLGEPPRRLFPLATQQLQASDHLAAQQARGGQLGVKVRIVLYIYSIRVHTHTHKYIVSGIKCTYSHRVCLASEDFGYVVPGCALIV
jgi:hypothetical protein